VFCKSLPDEKHIESRSWTLLSSRLGAKCIRLSSFYTIASVPLIFGKRVDLPVLSFQMISLPHMCINAESFGRRMRDAGCGGDSSGNSCRFAAWI
jgi:hypothetical protein